MYPFGNPTEAYRSWDWISHHGTEKKAALAAEFKAVMKAEGLVREWSAQATGFTRAHSCPPNPCGRNQVQDTATVDRDRGRFR